MEVLYFKPYTNVMDLKLKIFSTNWVNLVGIFIAVYIANITSELVKIESIGELGNAMRIGFLGGLFGLITYGFIFWIGFITAMFLLDILLMNKRKELLNMKLLVEWIVVSIPFIYWFARYTKWIFLVAVIAFFITQFIRRKKILKVIQ